MESCSQKKVGGTLPEAPINSCCNYVAKLYLSPDVISLAGREVFMQQVNAALQGSLTKQNMGKILVLEDDWLFPVGESKDYARVDLEMYSTDDIAFGNTACETFSASVQSLFGWGVAMESCFSQLVSQINEAVAQNGGPLKFYFESGTCKPISNKEVAQADCMSMVWVAPVLLGAVIFKKLWRK